MQLAHTMIRISNLEKSLKFYCDILGLYEVKCENIGDEATLVLLSDNKENYYLELTLNHDGREYTLGNKFGHLAFYVEDLDSIITTVKKKNWWFRLSKPSASSKYIFVKDPDGYDIEILQK